jgi:hypothetical protein
MTSGVRVAPETRFGARTRYGPDPLPACQRTRVEAGTPSPVIRLSTLQPIFASVRWLGRVRA